MIQLIVDGFYIDLYDLEPPKFNFLIDDITDTSARSIFTRTFRVPATANNNKFFKNAFFVNGVDFDVTIKREARINVDGILFRVGELRLNKIYTTRENERIDYECIFLGETRSLATSIGEKALCDIDTTELDHELNYLNIIKSWTAYPEGSITDGLFAGNVLYPLVDFGNTYNDNGNVIETRMAVGGGTHFTTPGNPLLIDRFKPMVRVKYLWDKIFDEAGFTYSSNFINSNTFKQLYASAWGNDNDITTQSAISNYFQARRSALDDGYYEQDIDNPETQVDYMGLTFDYNNNYNLSTDTYTAPSNGTYTFSYEQVLEINNLISSGSSNLTFRLKRNGILVDSDVHTFFASTGSGNFYFSHTFSPIVLNAGDTIQLWIDPLANPSTTIAKGGTFNCIDAPGDLNISYYLDCDTKQIEFIKTIINKFRLVLSPDKNNPTNFIIEPWSDFIGSGELFDWTHKLDVSKDFTIEPVFYTQTSKITFTDTEAEDFLNTLNQETFDEVYGTLKAFDPNELITGEREIKGDLPPTPVTQIEGANQTTGGGNNHGMDNMIIPQIHTHNAEDTGLQHTPIKTKTRILFYNGLKNTGIIPATTNDWYIEDENGTTFSHTTYPMVSEYSIFPTTPSTIYLNWQREKSYINYDLLNYELGGSVYERYWSDYISSLYNKWSRKITAYFILDYIDLHTFSFDDVIRVKDTYYYVSKIIDAVVGKKTSVKVELIKLLDYDVRITPVRPRRIWNNTNVNWEDAVFRWDL